MSEDNDFRQLEVKNAFSVLLYLYKSGKVQKTGIYENVSYTSTMPTKLKYLEERGYITMASNKFENNTIHVELTDLGRSIAKKLREIELLISSDHTAFNEISEEGKMPTNHGASSEQRDSVG